MVPCVEKMEIEKNYPIAEYGKVNGNLKISEKEIKPKKANQSTFLSTPNPNQANTNVAPYEITS